MNCPRCGSAFVVRKLGGISFDGCAQCGGTLLEQRQLVTLLRRLSLRHDLSRVPEPVADKGAGLACPLCSRSMSNYGYMAANLVMIDRCSACNVVFVDGGELETLSLQYGRVNARSEDNRDFTLSELRRTKRMWGHSPI